ncbi:MAG: FAD-dependent oxidoreductase [bacterium]
MTSTNPASIGAVVASLPEYLRERVGLVSSGAPAAGASYVLYWAHHALRVDENPALEAAAEIATALDLPLLVFCAVSGSHPHLSDRHVSFFLEGVRDFAAGLADLGVPFAAAIDATPRPDASIDRLASRAAVVVTEDFPAQPFPDWIASVGRRTGRPVIAVDTSCVVPMNAVDGVFDRAFAFRDASARERRQRVGAAWPRFDWTRRRWPLADHTLPEIDWAKLDLAALVSSLDIDHAIGPVVDTPGGARAAERRWRDFLDHRLADYARNRNDAALVATSRMSAYLHYGMISPFRVAREAHHAGGEGGEKFLDELLVWRELSYHWCRHEPSHATIAALPAWARRTLEAHRNDPRDVQPHEMLERGRTGDRLWDLAQRSLVVHGELHNNVRMTWGKAIPFWTKSPEDAIATLIDLNNRFALDGADPASYAGLLWCVGLFDRAFPPEGSVLGRVRARPTSDHAARLDLEAFEGIVTRPAHTMRVAVIGAGLAGVACARTLADHGVDVTILEKSRGAGGRMSTRRGDFGAFDHGAQYFTARDARFRARIADWIESGVVARWDARFAEFGSDGARLIQTPPRFVGTPSMSALCGHIAAGIAMEAEMRVVALERDGDCWQVHCSDRTGAERVFGPFDAVLSTTPAPQAAAILGAPAPALAAIASRIAMRATWSLMLAFPARVELGFDHAEVLAGAGDIGATLAWISRVGSKPGRSVDGIDRWVVLARPEWSEERLERRPEEIAPELTRAFAALCAKSRVEMPAPTHELAHRWRFALASREGGLGSAFDGRLGLGIAGDWMRGTRVEDAYLSGVSLAGRVLGVSTARARMRAGIVGDQSELPAAFSTTRG